MIQDQQNAPTEFALILHQLTVKCRMKNMTHKKRLLAILANFFIPLAGISTDIYLPSLPALTQHFGVTKAAVQFTVTAFTVGMAVMQLVAGPISDALGRKKLLVVSAIIQLLAIILILYAPSIGWMIGFRFIQGSAAAFMIVPARAILNDTFEGDDLKKQFNYATMSFALGPIVGPFIGGYLQKFFGWEANFIFILCYAIIALSVALFIYRETIAHTKHFSPSHLWHNYRHILKNRLFLVSAIFTACLFAYTAFFNVAGPFLIEISLQKSPVFFGHMALLIGVAWFIGNTLSRLLFYVGKTTKVVTGLLVTIAAALAMLFFSTQGYFTVTLFIVPIFFMIMMSGSSFAILTAECLSMFPDLAASTNACFFGFTWTAFSLFTVVAALTKAHSLIPISAALLGVAILCLALFVWVNRITPTPDAG